MQHNFEKLCFKNYVEDQVNNLNPESKATVTIKDIQFLLYLQDKKILFILFLFYLFLFILTWNL